MWFSWGRYDVGRELHALRQQMGFIMGTFKEALAGWTGYANQLKSQNDELRTKLQEAQSTLDDFAAIDAAEDAEQAQQLQQQLADQLAAALDAVKNPPQEPETPADPEEPEAPLPPQPVEDGASDDSAANAEDTGVK